LNQPIFDKSLKPVLPIFTDISIHGESWCDSTGPAQCLVVHLL
jgi:hypothetical protein